VKMKETLISLLFLRPAVDAYRVSTNHEDEEAVMESLTIMIMNKVREKSNEPHSSAAGTVSSYRYSLLFVCFAP